MADTIGIIAEYNPFHNGHRYQIEEIKRRSGAQNIVVVISGDFVQRGVPAWTDKYMRTRMALLNGADFVFELPCACATSSAEGFASAGISLLTGLSFVDGVCFGSELDDLPLLWRIAKTLTFPPKDYEQTIASLTAAGGSYPAARQTALEKLYPDAAAYLSTPNTILALEYLKAILLQDSPLRPFCLKRAGLSYHDETHLETLSSAAAVRAASKGRTKKDFLTQIQGAVPDSVHRLLAENPDRYPLTEDAFSVLLYYRLANLCEQDKSILDMTDEIYHRIENHRTDFTDYAGFTAQIKTKQYTYSRISRVLLHCLLNITKETAGILDSSNKKTSCLPSTVRYARLLGFRSEKSALLRKSTKLPVITKPADGFAQIDAAYPADLAKSACAMYRTDLFASDLYRQVQEKALGCARKAECRCQPIIL